MLIFGFSKLFPSNLFYAMMQIRKIPLEFLVINFETPFLWTHGMSWQIAVAVQHPPSPKTPRTPANIRKQRCRKIHLVTDNRWATQKKCHKLLNSVSFLGPAAFVPTAIWWWYLSTLAGFSTSEPFQTDPLNIKKLILLFIFGLRHWTEIVIIVNVWGCYHAIAIAIGQTIWGMAEWLYGGRHIKIRTYTEEYHGA